MNDHDYILPVGSSCSLRTPPRDDPRKPGMLYRGLPNALPECDTCETSSGAWLGSMTELSNGVVALSHVTCTRCRAEWVRTRHVATDEITFTKCR